MVSPNIWNSYPAQFFIGYCKAGMVRLYLAFCINTHLTTYGLVMTFITSWVLINMYNTGGFAYQSYDSPGVHFAEVKYFSVFCVWARPSGCSLLFSATFIGSWDLYAHLWNIWGLYVDLYNFQIVLSILLSKLTIDSWVNCSNVNGNGSYCPHNCFTTIAIAYASVDCDAVKFIILYYAIMLTGSIMQIWWVHWPINTITNFLIKTFF